MDYPTPDDPKQSPVWENYVVAQACAAALGLIPSHAHALGVRVDRHRVTLVVQAPDGISVEEDQDVVDIRDDLATLLGTDAHVAIEVTRTKVRDLNDPHEAVRWFYAARV